MGAAGDLGLFATLDVEAVCAMASTNPTVNLTYAYAIILCRLAENPDTLMKMLEVNWSPAPLLALTFSSQPFPTSTQAKIWI